MIEIGATWIAELKFWVLVIQGQTNPRLLCPLVHFYFAHILYDRRFNPIYINNNHLNLIVRNRNNLRRNISRFLSNVVSHFYFVI